MIVYIVGYSFHAYTDTDYLNYLVKTSHLSSVESCVTGILHLNHDCDCNLLHSFQTMPLSQGSSSIIGPGLGNILDSAVKTAVTHLASSPEGIDRSRVDFLYDEEEPPQYDYFYEEDINNINYYSPSPPTWSKHFPIKRRKDFPPPPSSVVPSRVSKVSRTSSITDLVFAYLPFLLLLPLIAAASYYLVVQNGPTPVVKEREASEWGLLGLEK